MTTKLKLAFAVWCVGAMTALTAPVAMAQTETATPAAPAATKEFVAETPNVPLLGKPTVKTMDSIPFNVPEPGSLSLVFLAALAAAAVARRNR